ncbi:hypothetical protein [Azorhizobium doebereinerae]|uniref:hypothetical protein n=1 Tax=Azorhizobium doebereinerae TaxID=281091 RepID=UPI0012EC7FFC|nr:hypothetical protein [Azorhizobium doebereinerae]
MNQMDNLTRRMDELISEADQLDNNRIYFKGTYSTGHHIDEAAFAAWKMSAKNILIAMNGPDSVYLQAFMRKENGGFYNTNHCTLIYLKEIIISAKKDYCQNAIARSSNMSINDTISQHLGDAKRLLSAGFTREAAIITGISLEAWLIDLCLRHKASYLDVETSSRHMVNIGAIDYSDRQLIIEILQLRNDIVLSLDRPVTSEESEKLFLLINKYLKTARL